MRRRGAEFCIGDEDAARDMWPTSLLLRVSRRIKLGRIGSWQGHRE
jgi:hypothetical protein